MGLAGPKRLSTRNCRYGRAVIEKRQTDPDAEFLGGSNRGECSPENRNGPQTAERPRNEGSQRFKSSFLRRPVSNVVDSPERSAKLPRVRAFCAILGTPENGRSWRTHVVSPKVLSAPQSLGMPRERKDRRRCPVTPSRDAAPSQRSRQE